MLFVDRRHDFCRECGESEIPHDDHFFGFAGSCQSVNLAFLFDGTRLAMSRKTLATDQCGCRPQIKQHLK